MPTLLWYVLSALVCNVRVQDSDDPCDGVTGIVHCSICLNGCPGVLSL